MLYDQQLQKYIKTVPAKWQRAMYSKFLAQELLRQMNNNRLAS